MDVISLDHLHVYAAAPEASARFYVEHFGATEIARNNNINGDLRIFLSLGGQVLVLGDFPKGLTAKMPGEPGDGAYKAGFGIAHIGLRVASVEKALVELAAKDVAILGQEQRDETGLTYAYIAAPDGMVIELTQYGITK